MKSPTDIDAFAVNEPVFAADDLMGRIGGNIDLLKRLVALFDQTGSQYLTQIEAAISSDDAAQLTGAAHSLKGAAANLGGMRASEFARKLEECGRSNQTMDLDELLQATAQEVRLLIAALQQFVGDQE